MDSLVTSSLNYLITIEKETTTKNAVGTPIKQWGALCTCYANVYSKSDSLLSLSEGQLSNTSIIFTIRYRSDIDYSCRILFENIYYKIIGLNLIRRKVGLKLTGVAYNFK